MHDGCWLVQGKRLVEHELGHLHNDCGMGLSTSMQHECTAQNVIELMTCSLISEDRQVIVPAYLAW